MFTSLQTRLKRASRLLPVALLPFAAQAQVPGYNPANATNIAGTYTDISTTGTAIATANTDDANSAAQPIGFTFNFNGTAFTQFVLSTNGFIRLGAAAPSSATLFYTDPQAATGGPIASTNPADVNLVMPFAVDLTAGMAGGTGYQVATTGAAGSRVTTIQWTNVQDKASTILTQFLNFSFQAKLYESGQIEFVYGPTTPNTTGNNFHTVAVGLKGSSSAQSTTVTKGSTQAWSAATFQAGDYTGNAHNVRETLPADPGRTYRFAPTVLLNNDAAVTALYTLGKASSAFGSPVTAQVVVTNAGSSAQTNLPVTLTVSGATTYTNTQTVASLASGASTTVTFSYPVTGTTGTNTVVVSVPADDLASNNTQTTTQAVTANDQSYVVGTTFVNGAGVASAGSAIVTRYTATGPAAVTTVTPTFYGAGTAGSTYQIVVYSATAGGLPGTLLYTSPSRPRPTIAGSATAADPVAIPSISVGTTFFVGVKTIGADNISIAYQTEAPLRGGTFFYTTNGTTFTDINTSTLNSRLAIDVTLGAPSACGVATGLAVSAITPTSASLSFTPASGATSYTVTYTPAGGTATTVTPAPTGSPVALTGLTGGTTYTVSVTTNCAGGLTSGAVTTTFTTTTPGPANDDCTAATVLPVAATCTPVNSTNTASTASPASVPAATCGTAGPDVWFAITVPTGGALTVTTSASTGTGTRLTDTVLQLYSGTCGALTPIGCNDDTNGLYSQVPVSGLTAGATIYARVFGFASATGDFGICAVSGVPFVCAPVTNLAAANVTNTSANITFTAPAGATSYTVTYTPAGGTATTVTPAPTGSPVALTGLTLGTTYTVRVTTNCGAGQTSTVATLTFTTTGATTYCTTGLNGFCGGNDITGVSITSTTLNATGLTCTSTAGNAYTAYPATGANTGSLAAGSTAQINVTVQTGSSLSVWIDFNHNFIFEPTEYVQPTLNSTTPVVTASIVVPANAVLGQTGMRIRSRLNGNPNGATDACSPFGSGETKDFTVTLRLGSATRNEALGATVGLYPNPAHQSFTLNVPAGSLHAASASLINALGQVVQTRQLNLPVAGGTADFNVSGLAAGVYSLQLKTGDTLVVKRVVVE